MFSEEEVQFQDGDITLAGTLAIPQKVTKTPAVVLLSGYGPHNRDSDEQEFSKFRVISSHLVKQGIAVLRYDDRGAGNSSPVTWSDYTFHDLSNEALAAIDFLCTREEIDSSRIGLLGDSLGAAIAPLAASRSKEVSFVVLLGGHGQVGSETGAITRKYIGRQSGETEKELEKGEERVKTLFEAILTGEGWKQASSRVREEMVSNFLNLPDDRQKLFKTAESYLKNTYEGFLLARGYTPMYRSFLRYDPALSLEKVFCPSLLLFAELDIFHPPEHHKDVMIEALKKGENKEIISKVFLRTDHEFTTTNAMKKKEFIAGFLSTISDWILDTCVKNT